MHRYANFLILIAFAVRSLLPMGLMLAAVPDHAGAVEIVICTGHGPQSLTVDDEGRPLPAKAPAADKSTCPYAPVGAVAANDETPVLAQTVRYAALTYAIAAEIFRATPKPGAQSARGPPSLLT